MATNPSKKASKKSEPAKKINLVSINYKIGKKLFTAEISKSSNDDSSSMALGNAGSRSIIGDSPNFDISCGPDCRCMNGFKERLISFGGAEIWMRTDEPC